MRSYVLSPAARADLEEIWDYTSERWGADQAEEYVREIQRAVERIVDNPLIGRACDDVRPGYRKHPVASHTLYYRFGGNVIDVVRILHQRMDLDRRLD
ncbi:type II toxin-antitoxin system RelE/ParE family toxin [Mycobacterium sp. CVI_P3]|uniref:Toxin n=1 Tax=Mycobacterium pinniadriaticum TaxID=2994102 RepID=A0ABT3SBN5_9MYCO|nr:type II toxin-antitoxin system RelE/ParE family toxin [Mycobacterium pinniadriaticum]MCX2930506.1 type II toxin-antitoxin system RelE/ParE family toxin [Mycobacterium pinniadriaticum]MCX2936930.1 type II toxin-antitoxin system RelE/ParE family toxin [Mycobacterium pinniadriaticum]